MQTGDFRRFSFCAREINPNSFQLPIMETEYDTRRKNPHGVLLDLKSVCKILSRSKASVYRDIAAERFPKQIRMDLSRFDAAPLMAFTAPKETDYALPVKVMRSMIPRGD